jgi:AcrR family transcriptional regulator
MTVDTRDRLLEAALVMIREQGITGLTLDNVAKAARMSKGGLLHHFRSKDALVEALLRQLMDDFEARASQFYQQESERPGRWLRAYVRATFEDEPLPLELSLSLMASVTENAVLMALVRQDFEHWQERLLNDGVPRPRATIIRQAADAYWSERLIGVAPDEPEARLAIRDELLALTEAGHA